MESQYFSIACAQIYFFLARITYGLLKAPSIAKKNWVSYQTAQWIRSSWPSFVIVLNRIDQSESDHKFSFSFS